VLSLGSSGRVSPPIFRKLQPSGLQYFLPCDRASRIAVNSVPRNTDIIAGGASLTGANNLGLIATGSHALSTHAKAGAGGSIAITPSGAITVAVNQTTARLPKGEALDIAGGLTLSANHSGATSAIAESDATGKDAGVGLSLAVNTGVELSQAHLNRDVISRSGTVTIEAHNITDTSSSAKAGARGAPAPPAGQEGQTADQKASQTSLFGKKKTGTAGNKMPADKKQTKAKTSDGSFSIGGALAINVAVAESTATISEGTTLIAEGGSVTLGTSSNADTGAKADGSAAASDIGVGAAIAVNTAIVTNKAVLDGHVESHGLAVKAMMADDGAVEQNKPNAAKTHKSVVSAISGAGGKSVGVAGAGAINVAVIDSSAVIGSAGYVDAGDGAVEIWAENRTNSRVSASSKAIIVTGGSGGDSDDGTSVGVGASIAVNVGVHTARAAVNDSAILLNPASLSVKATGDHDMEASVVAGSAGDVSVSPAVANSASPERPVCV